MQAKLPTIAALAAVAVLGLSGCGSSNDKAADPGTTTQTHTTTSPETTTPASTTETTKSDHGMAGMVMVDIKDFMYEGGMNVKPGEQVMVTNDDPEAHTLTSDQAGMFAVTVAPDQTAMFVAPTKPGSYSYHCDFHSNMHGELVVS